MFVHEIKATGKIAKHPGDLNWFKILEHIAVYDGAIQCSQTIKVLNLAPPSVSQHIKSLTLGCVIESEKGVRSYSYILNKPC